MEQKALAHGLPQKEQRFLRAEQPEQRIVCVLIDDGANADALHRAALGGIAAVAEDDLLRQALREHLRQKREHRRISLDGCQFRITAHEVMPAIRQSPSPRVSGKMNLVCSRCFHTTHPSLRMQMNLDAFRIP